MEPADEPPREEAPLSTAPPSSFQQTCRLLDVVTEATHIQHSAPVPIASPRILLAGSELPGTRTGAGPGRAGPEPGRAGAGLHHGHAAASKDTLSFSKALSREPRGSSRLPSGTLPFYSSHPDEMTSPHPRGGGGRGAGGRSPTLPVC